MFATVAGVARLIVLEPVKYRATDVTTKEGNVSTARARLVKKPIAEMNVFCNVKIPTFANKSPQLKVGNF